MKQIFTVARGYFLEKIRWHENRITKTSGGTPYYAGHRIMNCNEGQNAIKELIASGKPCCIARLGGNELFSMSCFEFDIDIKKKKAMNQLHMCGGFFPNDTAYGERFNDCMKEACGQMDLLGVFASRFEDYYIRKYVPKSVQLTRLFDLEPWNNPGNPWSDVLEGKKVLVIYPLSNTIQNQYAKREKLFKDTNILPQFELKTLQAVQTVAGEKDDRFADWFEALEWMYQEAMKIDFDIAVIGCGAYGFPLAAKLKKAGKQAFHLGGATQLLFGIKGKRWLEENEAYAGIQRFFNEDWVFPAEEDRPQNANTVENGCYW